jgi:hypothetical protein
MAGRVRLRPNLGFPRCLACDVTPREIDRPSRSRRAIASGGKCEGQGDVVTWQGGATGAHYMRGGVVEQGQAVSPGSGGASTYLRRGFPDCLPL